MNIITRYDPFRILRDPFWGSFSDIIGDFTDDMGIRVDVYEQDNNVVVEADLPGFDPKDVDITLTSDSATIKAAKEEKVEEKNRDYVRRERRFGSCARTVNFPVQVVPDKVEATFTDGTLRIVAPKQEATSPTSIKVDVKKK